MFEWNRSLAEFNSRIYYKNYMRGVLASKNREDLIYHEAAHFITFQDCQSFYDFRIKEVEVRKNLFQEFLDMQTQQMTGRRQ